MYCKRLFNILNLFPYIVLACSNVQILYTNVYTQILYNTKILYHTQIVIQYTTLSLRSLLPYIILADIIQSLKCTNHHTKIFIHKSYTQIFVPYKNIYTILYCICCTSHWVQTRKKIFIKFFIKKYLYNSLFKNIYTILY